MSEPSDELSDLRGRILFDFQVVRGTTAWAPWGASGWSAVEVRTPQRKWAQVHRVKPASGERSGKTVGKVRKDQLVKRDPKLKGKDRPGFAPDEIFAKSTEPETEEPEVEEAEAPTPVPAPTVKAPAPKPVVSEPLKPQPRRTDSERFRAIEKLLAMIDDDSTVDDW